MVNAQEWLDQNYPKETRENIEILKINDKDLEGHLDLRDFVNLENFHCFKNRLTSLDLSKNSKIAIVSVRENGISAKLDIFSHLTHLTVYRVRF